MKRKAGEINKWFVQNIECVAVTILVLWCLLPVVMSAYSLLMNALNRFPTNAVLLAMGQQVGYINYNIALETYYHIFLILGIPTLLFAITSLLL